MNTRDESRNESGTVTAMGVVEVGVVDTCYGVSQPGAHADRYRCACLVVLAGMPGSEGPVHRGWLGVVTGIRLVKMSTAGAS